MNKKTVKLQEQTDKKNDSKSVRDRGDNHRKIKDRFFRIESTQISRAQKVMLDRGDTRKTKNEDSQIKYDACSSNRVAVSLKTIKAVKNGDNRNGTAAKKTIEIDKIVSINKDFTLDDTVTKPSVNHKPNERGKVIEEKKTLEKEPFSQQTCGKYERNVTENTKDNNQKETKIKEVIIIPYMLADDTVTHISDENLAEYIKPIIKTVASKVSTAKLFKSVSFKDQSEKSLNLSRTRKKDAKPKSLRANLQTKVAWSKTKVQNKVKSSISRRKKNDSPSSDRYNIEFPPTEVVKWEPSCVTSQTRPYYEAWIDTTLTAISKCSENERLLLERDLVKAFQYLKRPVTPELVYQNLSDERYTGRIKVRHR